MIQWADTTIRLHAVVFSRDSTSVRVAGIPSSGIEVEDLVAHLDAGAVIGQIDLDRPSADVARLGEIRDAIEARILRPHPILVVVPRPWDPSDTDVRRSTVDAICAAEAIPIFPYLWHAESEEVRILRLGELVLRLRRERGLLLHVHPPI